MSRVQGFVGYTSSAQSTYRLSFPSQLDWPSQYYNISNETDLLVCPKKENFSGVHLSGKEFSLNTFYTGNPIALTDVQACGLDRPYRGGSIESAYAKLDGRFSLLSISEDEILLATDLIGAGGAYYYVAGHTVFFASHLGLLLHVLPRGPAPDPIGIAGLFSGKNTGSRRTPFSGVHRLLGGQALRINRHTGTHVVERLASLRDLIVEDGMSAGERASKIALQLSESILRVGGNERHLLLSGGLDSQAVAKATVRLGLPLNGYTFGQSGSADVLGAKLVAKRLRASHAIIPFDRWTASTKSGFIASLFGGMSGPQVLHMIGSMLEWTPPGILLHGYLGDALSGAHLPRHADVTEQVAIDVVFDSMHLRTDVDVSSHFPDETETLRSEVSTRYHEELSDLPPHQRLAVIDLEARQALRISTVFEMADALVTTYDPFYYRPLLRTFLSSPLSHWRGQSVYRQSMRPVWAWKSTLDGYADRLQRRVLGTGVSRNVTDWKERIAPDRDWLMQTASLARDPRVAKVSRRSLESWNGNAYPLAVVGTGLALADYFAAEGSQALEEVCS